MSLRLPPVTSSERVAYLLLVLIVLLVVLLRLFLPDSLRPSLWSVYEQQEDTIPPADSARYTARRWKTKVTEVADYALFPFDPNTADSATLRQLGLSPFVVRNIHAYRARGGQFRTRRSFAKLYGLSKEKYEELVPFLLLPDSITQLKQPTFAEIHNTFTPKLAPGEMIEINAADTAILKRIPGIGRGYAGMIVRYRRALGGFYAPEQLYEIEQLPDSVVQRALPFVRVEKDSVRPMNLTIASIERMQAHPYLNFYQAKVIYEYRRKRGALKELKQLRLYEEFSEADFKRLTPYVSFE